MYEDLNKWGKKNSINKEKVYNKRFYRPPSAKKKVKVIGLELGINLSRWNPKPIQSL